MKHPILLAAAAFCIATTAPCQSSAEPKELLDLRASFEKARSAALSPLEKKYLDALTGLKDRLTKKGDLNGALAVQDEIAQLQTKASSAEPTTKSLLSRLRRTRWSLNEGNGPAHITFQGNEVLWEDEKSSQKWTLKISQQKDGSLLIDWGGAARRVEVSSDLSTLTVARAIAPDKKVTAQKEEK